MTSWDASEQAELYRALAEIAPDPVVAIDASNTILWANAAVERTFGYDAAALVDQSLLILIPERYQARHVAGMARYIETGRRRISWERVHVPIRTRSGTEIPVEITFTEYTSPVRGSRMFVGFLRDVTDRVESERALTQANAMLQDQAAALELQTEELQSANTELQHANAALEEKTRLAEDARAEADTANRAKSDFLATMSHELRTPLNAIGGYADLLLLGLRGTLTTEQMDDIERIRRSGQHLLALIDDVLNFAKLEAGSVEFELKEMSVATVLDEVNDLIRPQVDAKSLRYVEQNGAGDVVVRADADKVRQVILNLLANAVKFTEPGGEIALVCSADASDVRIAVRDTGRGIPTAQLRSVFDPFVQVDRQLTTPGQQGVGLGLSISRDLARAMGGELSAVSTVGEGSTFTLRLPRS